MTVPVLWVSRNPEILHRGYADQSLLEGLMDRSVWRPPNAFEFRHHEVRGEFPADLSGAVVVVPFRHMTEHVGWLAKQLDRLTWSVVILTSEEEWLGDWRALEAENRRLWVMQARPEHENVSQMLPCGWYPGTREGIAVVPYAARPLAWFFAGQVTHVRREECVAALRRTRPYVDNVLHENATYFDTTQMNQATYYELIAQAKIVPCPSGPVSLCTGRVEEALEAGCVPIVDMIKPEDPQFDYWTMLFGERHPLRGVHDWSTFPQVMTEELAAWPANANRCWSFWQQWKRQTAHRLDDDVRAVNGSQSEPAAPDDLITIIVTTSPATLHPSTEHIEATIDSLRVQLPDAEIIVACDGVRPEQEKLRAQYEDYQHRLFWLTNFKWHNVVPLRLEEWGHQAHAVRAALELVTTPLVMLVEHDTPLKETPIDWAGICAFIETGEANLIRFHHEAEILPDHEGLMIDHDTQWIPEEDWQLRRVSPTSVVNERHGLPLRRTMAWWQRPHVASTRFYRERVMPFFTPECRTMIEDPLYGHISSEYLTYGEAAWWDWRMFVYCPEGSMQRSYHLDSRGAEPKYSMVFPR